MALIFLLWMSSVASAQLQLFQKAELPPLSDACIGALTANISCTTFYVDGQNDVRFGWPNDNLTTDYLDELCTASCASSIATYRTAALDACANDVYNDTRNTADWDYTSTGGEGVYDPIVLPDYYLTNYKQTCLKDSSGAYCHIHLLALDGGDPCDECNVRMFKAELEDGYYYNSELASVYESLTSSCSVSTLPVTTPPSVVVQSASFVPTVTCDGSMVSVPTGRSCDAVAESNNISTWQLLAANGLNGDCGDFPTSGKLCISGSCNTHLASAEDDCLSLAITFNITITQLLTWNPNLNPNCDNFKVVVGHQICVSNPSNFTLPVNDAVLTTTPPTVAAPVPTDVVEGTNTRCGSFYHVQEGDTCASISVARHISLNDFYFLNPEINKDCTNLFLNYSYCVLPVGDIATYPGYSDGQSTSGQVSLIPTLGVPSFTGTPIPFGSLPNATIATLSFATTPTSLYPLAKGSRNDCARYKDNSFGDVDCGYLNAGVSTLDFVDWNPSLNPFNCTLRNETQYCTLLDVAFVDDSTNSNSSDFDPPPSNAAQNSTTSCDEWYTVQSGDSCTSVEDQFNITFADFYTWNPSIKKDCTALQLQVAYCIAGPGDSANGDPTPTQSSTTSDGGFPTPTRPAMGAKCTQYYTISRGEECSDVTAKFHPPWDWTLWDVNWRIFGSNCNNIHPGIDVCIGIEPTSTASSSASATATTSTGSCAVAPGPTQTGMPCDCKKFVKQSGDNYCGDLASQNGISLAQFYKLNPAVGDSCQYLVGGDWYCVASPLVGGSDTTTTAKPTATCATAAGPTQTGMPCNCKKFVQQTSGKYCGDLASDAGIALDQFYKWNPAVGSSCQYLIGGDYYCVSA